MAQARKEHEEWVAANRDKMAMLALEAAQKKQEAAATMLAIEEQARIEADAAVSRVLRSQADEAADKMNREMLAAQQMFARFDAQMADAERAVEAASREVAVSTTRALQYSSPEAKQSFAEATDWLSSHSVAEAKELLAKGKDAAIAGRSYADAMAAGTGVDSAGSGAEQQSESVAVSSAEAGHVQAPHPARQARAAYEQIKSEFADRAAAAAEEEENMLGAPPAAGAPLGIKPMLKVPWSKAGGYKLPEASYEIDGWGKLLAKYTQQEQNIVEKPAAAGASLEIKPVLKVPWSKAGGYKLPEASTQTDGGSKSGPAEYAATQDKNKVEVERPGAAGAPFTPLEIRPMLKVPWSKAGGYKLPEASAKTSAPVASSAVDFFQKLVDLRQRSTVSMERKLLDDGKNT